MTVYEMIKALTRFDPGDEVFASVLPKGNRRAKIDLCVVSVNQWGLVGRGARGSTESVPTILLEKRDTTK